MWTTSTVVGTHTLRVYATHTHVTSRLSVSPVVPPGPSVCGPGPVTIGEVGGKEVDIQSTYPIVTRENLDNFIKYISRI